MSLSYDVLFSFYYLHAIDMKLHAHNIIIHVMCLSPLGFTSVVLSTIERRYQFSSTAAGLIASTFDMAVLVSVVFISYFGGKGHKPRILGISLIVQGTGT